MKTKKGFYVLKDEFYIPVFFYYNFSSTLSFLGIKHQPRFCKAIVLSWWKLRGYG